ncbi:MAG: ABC transporter substrate-binding protein [Actinobacteria bacterium]|nr:ABC transporter substrate-binding protein [Actinomycetota bacterium]
MKILNILKKISSIIPVFIIVFILSFILISCKNISTHSSPDKDDQFDTQSITTIRIGSLKGPTSIGMLKLYDENPKLGDNINTVYEIVPNPEIMISKLISGEIDIATLPTNTAVNLYNKGADYKLAAIIGYGVLYLLSQDKEIRTWSDLEGEEIYIPSRGSTPDVVLRYLLDKNDLNPETDLKLIYSFDQVELSQLMINKSISISILPEPFVTMVLRNNPGTKIVFDIEKEWKKSNRGLSLPMSCLVLNSSLAERFPQEFENFLKYYMDSIGWANENLDKVAELVEKYDIGIDPSVVQEAVPRCNIRFTDVYEAKETVDQYIHILYDFSLEDIGGALPDEDFYYQVSH